MEEVGLRVLCAALAVLIGSILQGSLGFGLALVAAPVLVFLNDDWVPGALFVAGWPLMVLMTWRERKQLNFRSEFQPWLGLIAGVGLGLFLLQSVEASRVTTIVAVVILLAVGLSVSGLRIAMNFWTRLSGGFLAGFMGATASIPGPALALLHQGSSPAQMRAILAPFFLLGNTLSLVGLWASGQLPEETIHVGLYLIPATLAGWVISARTLRWVRPALVRPAVHVFAGLAALSLLVRSTFF